MKTNFVPACLTSLLLLLSVNYAMADNHAADGQAVYEESCDSCHKGGWFSGGAPKIGDAEAWAGRAEKGLEALTQTTLQGVGTMTARGGCESCSDADIQAAVAYMLEALE